MSSMDMTIPGAVVLYDEKGHHVVYKVECRWGVRAFRSYRRYREFREWDQRLRGASCSTARRCTALRPDRARLPRRWMWNGRDPRTLRARREGLQAYLQGLQGGLCTRHRQHLDDFLLPRDSNAPGRAMVLDTREAVQSAEFTGAERSYHFLPTPPGLECYGDLEVQFGTSCLITVRGSGLNAVLQSPSVLGSRRQRRAAALYCRAFHEHFTPTAVARDALRLAGDPIGTAQEMQEMSPVGDIQMGAAAAAPAPAPVVEGETSPRHKEQDPLLAS